MKAREQRQEVLIPARLRADGSYRNVTIRNISTEGLMLSGAELPSAGTRVEVVRAHLVIDGRVVWSSGEQCGVRSRRPLDATALRRGFAVLAEPARTDAPGAAPQPRSLRPTELLETLREAHAELLTAITGLESVTACEMPDAARLSEARWTISRASRQRLNLIERSIYPSLLAHTSRAGREKLEALRLANAPLRAASTAHVTWWTMEKAIEEWPAYRRASFAMTGSMRKRIASEKEVLYPLLGGIEAANPSAS